MVILLFMVFLNELDEHLTNLSGRSMNTTDDSIQHRKNNEFQKLSQNKSVYFINF